MSCEALVEKFSKWFTSFFWTKETQEAKDVAEEEWGEYIDLHLFRGDYRKIVDKKEVYIICADFVEKHLGYMPDFLRIWIIPEQRGYFTIEYKESPWGGKYVAWEYTSQAIKNSYCIDQTMYNALERYFIKRNFFLDDNTVEVNIYFQDLDGNK